MISPKCLLLRLYIWMLFALLFSFCFSWAVELVRVAAKWDFTWCFGKYSSYDSHTCCSITFCILIWRTYCSITITAQMLLKLYHYRYNNILLVAATLVKLGWCSIHLFPPCNKIIPSGRSIVALTDIGGERIRLSSHFQSSYLHQNVICQPYVQWLPEQQ